VFSENSSDKSHRQQIMGTADVQQTMKTVNIIFIWRSWSRVSSTRSSINSNQAQGRAFAQSEHFEQLLNWNVAFSCYRSHRSQFLVFFKFSCIQDYITFHFQFNDWNIPLPFILTRIIHYTR